MEPPETIGRLFFGRDSYRMRPMERAKWIVGVDKVGRAASKRRASPRYIMGVDEVGRGPLAGPVTVCALLMAHGAWRGAHGGRKLRDSKKLTPKQREAWFRWVKDERRKGNVFFAIASLSPRAIDRMNVTAAANLAAARAITNVLAVSKVPPKDVGVFLDGGLYPQLKTSAEGGSASGGKNYKLKTIIKGDETVPAISLASVAAKVTRDRYMVRLAKRIPGYGFEIHKGYGTRAHIAAIGKRGPSPHHRLTFLKKYAIFER